VTSTDFEPILRIANTGCFGMGITISSSSAEIMADPHRVLDEMRAGNFVKIENLDLAAVRKLTEALGDEDDEDADMASFTKEHTGVDNAVFVSTKGRGHHAPRIKIAIDPPDSFNASSTDVSMAIHDCAVTGRGLTPKLREQAQRFIAHNRDALLDYWEGRTSTPQLMQRLRRPPE